ncbi:hypothetical protein G7054_g7977 [Neopestalotiopsis clavispora]|nr:hypothetical protein G7054_g7977 [Neopestalotiopsis clavispora]
MNVIQCQRSKHAEGLQPDPYSGQLVPIQKLITSNVPEISTIDDGVQFLHPNASYSGGYIPLSHRCIAAVPSQLAERLARVAQDAEANGRSHSAVQEYLKRWDDYGVLINITHDEENELKESLGLGRAESTNEILRDNISKMPRVFRFWSRMETSVTLESDVVIVGFSDCSGDPLMRVVVKRTETVTITLPPVEPSPKPKTRWWGRLGSFSFSRGTSTSGPWGDSSGGYSSYSSGGYSGGGFGKICFTQLLFGANALDLDCSGGGGY